MVEDAADFLENDSPACGVAEVCTCEPNCLRLSALELSQALERSVIGARGMLRIKLRCPVRNLPTCFEQYLRL